MTLYELIFGELCRNAHVMFTECTAMENVFSEMSVIINVGFIVFHEVHWNRKFGI